MRVIRYRSNLQKNCVYPEQIAEAQRELALRKQCYPQWIKSGKLDAGDATYQICCLEAMVRTLMQIDAEQRQLSLFGTGA